MERHFTVSGFVSHSGKTALHFHGIANLWLPPGGHVEADEDPIQAVEREVLEETEIAVEVLSTRRAYTWAKPGQLAPPVTIGIYDIPGDSHQPQPHQHIDFVYFTRPVAGAKLELPEAAEGWRWVSEDELREGAPIALPDGSGEAAVPEDVRILGIDAIEAVRAVEVGA
jgi:8-oxo-dGTP pyrophosphatase MutT (NUDIX family)